MTNSLARCLGIEDDAPCIEIATITRPVPLCPRHQMQVALAIVPEMLAAAASIPQRSQLPRVVDKEANRIVSRAHTASLDLSGIHGACVYFIRNGDRVKIGYTTNLRERLTALCMRPEFVVLVLQGGKRLESALHRYFADHRVPGTEWFKYGTEIHEYAEKKLTGRPIPSAPKVPTWYDQEAASDAVARADFRLGPEGDVVVSRDALLSVIYAHIGGNRGTHLAEIVRTLRSADGTEYWNINMLRQACSNHGVPVRQQLKVNGWNRPGVHRDDLAEMLPAAATEMSS